jgi:hypothetical protein
MLKLCLLACGMFRATEASCSSDMDCSLNGECHKNGSCTCDAPWLGESCELLDFAPTPNGGAYGFGAPFAVTSWGGNAIEQNGTWHAYFTEIGGARCGLSRWQQQSTVVHAVSPNASGPYTKMSTVLPHEAHNPQAIVFNGSWYIFHIGTANSAEPLKNCDNFAPSSLPLLDGCPVAPTGFQVFPAHCVGPNPHSSDCTASGDPWQIATARCASAMNLTECVREASGRCNSEPDCHSFALEAKCGDLSNTSDLSNTINASRPTDADTPGLLYKLIRLGANSTVSNPAWLAYAKPGQAPVPGPTPRAPTPPPVPGGTIHRASMPGGPFAPITATGYTGCNNPSPFHHKNGTLFLVCTWSLHSAPAPEGPWHKVRDLKPPSTAARHWEDPYLFITDRGFHILSHTYSMQPYPSVAISGHAFSSDGHEWTFSDTEPYDNAVLHTNGSIQHFATMERPKFLFADSAAPTRPTHLITGVSPVWNTSNADPCAGCGHCSACKCKGGVDWTYTLARPLR